MKRSFVITAFKILTTLAGFETMERKEAKALPNHYIEICELPNGKQVAAMWKKDTTELRLYTDKGIKILTK